jgi:transcriptional activator SPT8
MRPVSLPGNEPSEGGILVNVGPDFFEADRTKTNGVNANEAYGVNGNGTNGESKKSDSPTPAPRLVKDETTSTPPPTTEDVTMAPPPDIQVDTEEAGSPYDPLFDDDMGGDADAEGESVIPSNGNTALPTPVTTSPPPSFTPGLALPTASALDTFTSNANGYETPSLTTPSKPKSETRQSPPGPTPLFTQNAAAGPSRGEGAARGIPLLTRTTYGEFSNDVMMTSTMDGQVTLMDRRVPDNGRVGRLLAGEKAPPWCMSACWSGDGNQVMAGRRNGTLDIWDVRRTSTSRAPNLLRTMKTPQESGSISCVVAFPDGRHIATYVLSGDLRSVLIIRASQDNIRLWNTVEYYEPEESIKKSKSRPPFKIVAGHHGGTISSMSKSKSLLLLHAYDELISSCRSYL